MKILKNIISTTLFLSLILVGCKSGPTLKYSYHPPEFINDGFEVGSLEEVNIDSVLLKMAMGRNSVIYHTYNSGFTWTAQNSGTGELLYAVILLTKTPAG